jgi:hypothetical protein
MAKMGENNAFVCHFYPKMTGVAGCLGDGSNFEIIDI